MGPLAVIDCGSNTFNLLVADAEEKPYRVLFQHKIPAGMMKGVSTDGQISEEAWQNVIQTLKILRELALQHGANEIYAVATAAFRKLNNPETFIQELKEKTGVGIRIISGDEEAQLIWDGVSGLMCFPENPGMILDIGGGSTECIYFQNNQPLQYWSRPCGAMALIQETRPSDPLKTEEIIKIEKRLEDYWGAALDFMYPAPPQLICGSSGFFDTLYEMYFRALYPDQVYQAPLHWEISVSALIPWLEKLERLSREERLKIPGMPAFRAEMAGVSARLITFFIKKFSPERIFGTRFALKEGYMIHCLMQNPKP